MNEEENKIMKLQLAYIGKNALNIVAVLILFILGSLPINLIDVLGLNYYISTLLGQGLRIFLTLSLGLLYGKKVLKMDNDEIGFSLKNFNPKWLIVAFALPLTVLAFYCIIPGSIVKGTNMSLVECLFYAIFDVGIPAGILEEFAFRGLIFRYMKKTQGTVPAVIIPAVLFALVHIGNMETFNVTDLILLILAGSSVAAMFTLIALQSDSIFNGAVVHALWNTLIIGYIFGVGAIVNGSDNISYIQIIPASSSKLITGGNFGIEAAVPAIIGYIIVLGICLMLYRKKNAI